MPLSLEALAAWATIVGTVIAALALVESHAWLVWISVVSVGVSVFAGLYARRGRLRLGAASTVIEGTSIDSLNIANLRRRVNRGLIVQEVHHTVVIAGEDMEFTWRCSGYCRTAGASAMDFSIDSENSTAFSDMPCHGFDLTHDPDMIHPIRPLLNGSDGISKKITVPFLEALQANQPFEMLLQCTVRGCVTVGSGYYTSTLSLSQTRVRRSVVRLIFAGSVPTWMRVYTSTSKQQAKLVKTLSPVRRSEDGCEYVDVIDDRPGKSARVYTFWRESI